MEGGFGCKLGYPFGSFMWGRVKNSPSSSYRYSFGGHEKDDEVKGNGNQIDYGMRIHDPRIARFLSTDPLYKEFAWNSSYAYAENEPISSIDLDGLEKIQYQDKNGKLVTENFSGKTSKEEIQKYANEDACKAGRYKQEVRSTLVDDALYLIDPPHTRSAPDWVKKATDAIGSAAQGLVQFNPLMGVPNDIMTLTGTDMYGNEATTADKVIAGVDLITFGTAKAVKYAVQGPAKVVNGANTTTTIISAGSAGVTEYKKKK